MICQLIKIFYQSLYWRRTNWYTDIWYRYPKKLQKYSFIIIILVIIMSRCPKWTLRGFQTTCSKSGNQSLRWNSYHLFLGRLFLQFVPSKVREENWHFETIMKWMIIKRWAIGNYPLDKISFWKSLWDWRWNWNLAKREKHKRRLSTATQLTI